MISRSEKKGLDFSLRPALNFLNLALGLKIHKNFRETGPSRYLTSLKCSEYLIELDSVLAVSFPLSLQFPSQL